MQAKVAVLYQLSEKITLLFQDIPQFFSLPHIIPEIIPAY